MINSNWEFDLWEPLVAIWIQTHTKQIFWQPSAEWSTYLESVISLIRILKRSNRKAQAHCTLSSLFAQHHGLWSKESLCPRNLANLELAHCHWDSLCPILGFREFSQVAHFMFHGFSLLDPPSCVSNSSWSCGRGEWTLSQ